MNVLGYFFPHFECLAKHTVEKDKKTVNLNKKSSTHLRIELFYIHICRYSISTHCDALI